MADAPRNVVELPAVVDLDALEGVRDVLAAALERGPAIVSGAGVGRVSTNGLVMRLSAAESARRDGLDFAVTAMSAPMLAAIDRLGFGHRFATMTRG